MPTLATFTQNIILQIKAIAIKKREIKGIEKKKKNRYIPCKKKEKKKVAVLISDKLDFQL